MGGKSTFMRQSALITHMAYCGLFVSAKACRLGPIDGIYTRIGAHDDLKRPINLYGKMIESSYILRHATRESLVILDEIGRGTSTYDGLSLAWAIANHLLTHTKSLTLLATHYFELTQISDEHGAIKQEHLSAHDTPSGLVFNHKICSGAANKSYGIQVAKLAGIPKSVVILHSTSYLSMSNKRINLHYSQALSKITPF